MAGQAPIISREDRSQSSPDDLLAAEAAFPVLAIVCPPVLIDKAAITALQNKVLLT
jgi:hypothetical protein